MFLFSFFSGGGFVSFWGRSSIPLWYIVGMVEALTSVEIILRYTHNARVVWIWTWGIALTSAISFVLFMQREDIHCFGHFFCLLRGSDHVRCFTC